MDVSKKTKPCFRLKKVALERGLYLTFIYSLVKIENQLIMKRRVLLKSKIWLQVGLMAFAVLMTTALSAQISGTVTDADNGEPLIGASVLIRGTTTGTVSDLDGNFTIDAKEGDVLDFSYTGYATQSITVGTDSRINVALAQGVLINEVVVTGYSSQRKRDITGAVTVIDAEELESVVASSVSQKLEGRAAGVTMATSGAPGEGTNIRIRGISGFGNNNPLWIIDGVPVEDQFQTGLNPNDVESIQVLKDASAASIYGARANNGVIIVTTKKGKAGKIKVSYDAYYGVQTPVGDYDLLTSTDDYIAAEISTYERAGLAIPDYIEDDGTLTEYIFPVTNSIDESTYSYPDNLIMKPNLEGTDWWDEVFDPAPVTDHNLNISGGTENATFNISAGYFKQEGTMIHTNFTRYSLRANSRFKAGKFVFGENLQFRTGERLRTDANNEGSVIGNIFKISPLTTIYDISGDHFAGSKANSLPQGSNPVAQVINGKDNVTDYLGLFGNAYGEFHFTDYLFFKSSIGIDMGNNFAPVFTFPTFENREPATSNRFLERWDKYRNWTWTNTINLNLDLGDKHALQVLAGYEAIQNTYRGIEGRISDYFVTGVDVRYLNSVLGNASSRSISSFGNESTLASMFGKVDYAFDDKYILSLTIRRDGSSKFSENNRYGVFPAASIGWRVSSEKFMEGLDWLDDLKLRAGYGVTGNQNIRDYNYSDNYGSNGIGNTGYAIAGGNTPAPGFALTSRGNPDTKWEENTSVNAGVDVSVAQGKFNFVFDWYERNIDGLLYQSTLPGPAGSAAAPFSNVAGMKNTGWDVAVSYQDKINSDWRYNIGINLSHYTNEITAIDGERDFFLEEAVETRDPIAPSINMIGHPISSFRGYTVEGIFQSQAEVDAHGQVGAKVGGLKFADLNGDGMITEEGDVGIIGSPHPDLTMGLNLGISYKNFDFTAFIFGVFGNEISNQTRAFSHLRQFNGNITKDVLANAWTESNTNTDIPALNADDPSSKQQSTYYIEDGSYIRGKQFQLGYTLPGDVLSGVGIENLRIYVQAQNLFTITDYSGADPAISNVNQGNGGDATPGDVNDIWTGFDHGNYPASKLWMFGLNLSF